jgi:hypothetical protein
VDKAEYKEQEKKMRNLIGNAKKKFERRLAEGEEKNKKPFYAQVRSRFNQLCDHCKTAVERWYQTISRRLTS